MYKCILITFLCTVIQFTFEKQINFCDKKYQCSDTVPNTICKLKNNCAQGPNCKQFKKVILTENEKQALVKRHNELRNMQALGKGPKSANGKPFPAASNMREIVWDKELEFLAQCWSNQCPDYHDACRKKSDLTIVGQNLAWSSQNEILNMTDRFYNECKNAPLSVIDVFDSPTGGPKIGHFTQLVWAQTSQIGCGRTLYFLQDAGLPTYFLTCNYAISGNFKGEPVYIKGKPCSKCPKGSKCHSKYKGLCTTKPSKSDMPDVCKYSPDPPNCQSPFALSEHKQKSTKNPEKIKASTKPRKTKNPKKTKKPNRVMTTALIKYNTKTHNKPKIDNNNGQCIIERKIIIINSNSDCRRFKYKLILIMYLLYHAGT